MAGIKGRKALNLTRENRHRANECCAGQKRGKNRRCTRAGVGGGATIGKGYL